MMALIRRLRLAHLLAVLAIVLMAGLGQHVHASEAVDQSAPTLTAGASGDEGGKAIPADAHCGACHLVRATKPAAVAVREPAILRVDRTRPRDDLHPDVAAPDEPARPPRRVHAV